MTKEYRKWIGLVALSLGVFMALLDVTIVNVALPTMVRDFNESFNNVQWVLNAYSLVLGVTLLIVSKIGDMYGLKKIFVISLGIFVLASAVNGLAPSLLVLDIGRGVQALGGAGMNALAMALVAVSFKGSQRGVALGILGSVIGLSSASGPLIGGYLVALFGWRSIFYVNIPIGLIAIILTLIYVDEVPDISTSKKIDFIGMFLSAASLFALIYGLISKENHPTWGWTSTHMLLWLGTAVVCFGLFIFVEAHTKQPMVNLTMFKNPHFIGTVIVALTLGAGIYSYNTYLTALMQNYMGYSALDAGVRQLTISIWSLILGPVTGYLGNRYSKKWMISGSLFLGGIGFLMLANAMTVKVSFAQLWPGMVLMGITNGMVNPLLNSAGMEGVAVREMGMASGLINVFRQIGVTLGIVTMGLVQSNVYEQYLTQHFSQAKLPKVSATAIHAALVKAGPFSGHAIAYSHRLSQMPFAKTVQQLVWQAYANGTRAVTLTAAGIVLVGGLCAAIFMRNRQMTH
ncbi:MFS transporter [Lactobacillus sp. CBA3605]|uniref:MFS transporter n=1 Tax=Lactobacillus sp. CBA3605 TaxID=2099788 RepID=UPI000CFA997C|nr:MFS transporter [Lactobacillus sp. CBA3605]AVK60318.1 MFS transporter [Lactobacillus sp. CBA3605]